MASIQSKDVSSNRNPISLRPLSQLLTKNIPTPQLHTRLASPEEDNLGNGETERNVASVSLNSPPGSSNEEYPVASSQHGAGEEPFFRKHFGTDDGMFTIWRSKTIFLTELGLLHDRFREQLSALLLRETSSRERYNFSLAAKCTFQKVMDPFADIIVHYKHTKHSFLEPIGYMRETTIRDEVLSQLLSLQELITRLSLEGSGLTLKYIDLLDVYIQKGLRSLKRGRKPSLRNIKIGCHFQLPKFFKSNHMQRNIIFNPISNDQECFLRSISYALHQRAISEEEYSRFKSTLNLKGIEFPISLKQVEKFEKQNNISVNIFFFDRQEDFVPLKISKIYREARHSNLILFYQEQTQKAHFVFIRDFDSLLRLYKTASGTYRARKYFYCCFCISSFQTKQLRDEHLKGNCSLLKRVKVKLPTAENAMLSFTKQQFAKLQYIPYIAILDTECFAIPCDEYSGSATLKKYKYQFNSYCLALQSQTGEIVNTWFYRGAEPIVRLLSDLQEAYDAVIGFLRTDDGCPSLSPDESHEYEVAERCCICEKRFSPENNEENGKKVRHHCHFSSKFKGAAHAFCNLKTSLPYGELHVFAHNSSRFDSPLLLSCLKKEMFEGVTPKLSCLGKSKNRYITFSINQFKFLDTLNFLNGSLESLVSNLKAMGDDRRWFAAMYEHFNDFEEEAVDMLLCKSFYPYESVQGWDYFEREEVPPFQHFSQNFLRFGKKEFSNLDYEKVKKVWNAFNCKNFGDYHDLYLSCDTILLACVFHQYRVMHFENFEVDPACFLTSPSLAWSSMLKKNKNFSRAITRRGHVRLF